MDEGDAEEGDKVVSAEQSGFDVDEGCSIRLADMTSKKRPTFGEEEDDEVGMGLSRSRWRRCIDGRSGDKGTGWRSVARKIDPVNPIGPGTKQSKRDSRSHRADPRRLTRSRSRRR